MKKTGYHLKSLSEIGEICAIRRQWIDIEVAQANLQIQKLSERGAAERAELETAHKGWEAAVGGGFLQLDAAHAWSVDILRAQERAEKTARDIEMACERQASLRQSQIVANAKCDAVGALFRSAKRTAQRKRDEALLQDSGDGRSSRWGTRCE